MAQPLTGGLFRLGETLGTGAQATVYAGTHARSGRSLAFKVAQSAAGNQALLAEHQALRAVRHPNIVGIHGLVRLDDGRCALVLDRAPGVPLAMLRSIGEPSRVEIALGLTRAVCALHGRGIVHGDLSPANVLVEIQESTVRVTLIDPGLGRAAAGVDGTVGYLAPEILTGHTRSPAADVYSLGCVLFELLEGAQPFPGELERQTHLHLHAEPTPALRPPGAVRMLLQDMLAKDPGGRPPTVEHVLVTLAEAFGRNPELELKQLASAILASTPQPAVRPTWQGRLQSALDALLLGRGAFIVLAGEEGSGRSGIADDLLTSAAVAGAWPRRVVDPTDGLFAPRSSATGGTADDDPIMEAVRRLSRRPPPQVLVVDAPREDVATLARVAEVLQTAARTMPLLAIMVVEAGREPRTETTRLVVESLNRETTARFLDEWLAPDPEVRRTLVEFLTQASVRTPAAARQLLRETVARGLLVRRPGAWSLDAQRLAAEADDIIRRTAAWTESQVRAQPADARLVLAATSALERPAARPTLMAVTGLTAASLDHALWTLEVEGLIRQTSDGRTQPAHRGLAEAALRLLGPGGAIELHTRAAELEDAHLGHDLAPAERVWHEVHAGHPVDWPDVLSAGETLLRVNQPGRTLRLLDARERVEPDRTVDRRASLLRAQALQAMGDLGAARAVLEAAVERAPDERLSLALCSLLVRQGEFREALTRLERLGDSPLARLDRARALQWTGAWDRADELARGIVDDPSLSTELRAAALHVRASCAWHRGDLTAAERLAMDGLARIGHGDRAIRADLLRSLGAARYYKGNMAGAREVLVQALSENRGLARVPEIAKTLNNLAMVLYSMGDWHGAAGLWDEFRLICARLGDPVELAHAHNNLGFLTIRLGEPDRAAQLFRACVEQAQDIGYQRIVPIAQANLGEALALCGDLEGADAAMAEAEIGLNAVDAQLDLMELQRRRAELDIQRGRPDDALARVGLIGAEFQPEVAPVEAGHLLRITAAAHRLRNETAEAEVLAREALRRFEEQSARYEAALAREELARCLQGLGRVVEANRVGAEALDTFRFLGARRDQERTTVLVRELTRQSQAGNRFARHGEVLLDVALHFGSTLDLDQLLPRVLHRLVELLNAERGLLALFDANGHVERAVTHNLVWAGPGSPLPVSQSLMDEVMRLGRAVIVDDVRTELQTAAWNSVVVDGLRSLVGLPLQARGGQTIGVLYFDTQTHLADDPRDAVELLTGITRLLGTAVENARLYREERFRTELLADMAHHFRTPLSVISANAEVVSEELPIESSLKPMATDIVAVSQRLYRMVDHTLEIARSDSPTRQSIPERLELHGALERHLASMQMLAAGQNLRLQLEAPRTLPPVMTLPDRLWIVVDNLIFNALKFAREGSIVVVGVTRRGDRGPREALDRVLADETDVFRRGITIVPELEAGFLEVSVYNEGRPVPLELRDKLFSRYQYGQKTARGHRSTGLGLAIVAQCARHLGGAVWLDAATDTSTRISFTLPLEIARG